MHFDDAFTKAVTFNQDKISLSTLQFLCYSFFSQMKFNTYIINIYLTSLTTNIIWFKTFTSSWIDSFLFLRQVERALNLELYNFTSKQQYNLGQDTA